MSSQPVLGASQAVATPYPDSPWVVLKFGGRSVSTAENWAIIAKLIRERLDEGVRPVVVHSALVGVSNALIALLDAAVAGGDTDERLAKIRAQHDALAKDLGVAPSVFDERFASLAQVIAGIKLTGEVSPRIHARVLCVGELAATELGAAYLRKAGLAVAWLDIREYLESATLRDQTERARFISARCDFSPDKTLQQRFAAIEGIVLSQGFIARNADGDTVLLGRGGSDTSAAYLAGKLEARRLEIWTDAPGFFSADPKAVPSARLIKSLHYREAQEIASAGGGILHPRSISPVRASGIPLYLKCTTHPEWEGSVISNAPDDDQPQLKAISHRSGITLLSMESMEMWHQVGFLADAFNAFREHGISVDLISTSESNVTVSIDTAQNVTTPAAIEALAVDLRKLCRVTIINDCAAVTLVGQRIRTILHELTPVLEVFQEQQVHLVTQAANDLNLTFVVNSEHAYRLVQHLHGLLVGKFEGGVFGETWERLTGGGAPAKTAPKAWWVQKKARLLEIGAQRDATYVYDRESIAKAIADLRGLKAVDAVFYAMKANPNREILKLVHDGGLNFECVSPGEIARVLEVLPGLDRKRILFTPNFAPRNEYEQALEQGVWVTLDNLFPLKQWGKSFKGKELFVRIDTGSGVLTPNAWLDTGRQLLKLFERLPDVRYVDVGGGLGVPEKVGQPGLDLEALDAVLTEVKQGCAGRSLFLEPGRFIVAQAGVLIARVTQTKGKGEVQYVGVGTGMNSLIRPALYGAYHDIVNLTRLGKPATELVTVVGPICETGDRLGSDRLMPPAKEGDVLLIANAGAYGYAMSSRYNLREPATEVLI